MLMKLYDDLCIGIPAGIRIDGCVVGKTWTTVRANGNVGIARTLECPANPTDFAASFLNGFLRDTANYMRWNSLAAASVGVAAMCAYYNTAVRAEGLDGIPENSALFPPAEFSGKSVALVGDTGLDIPGAVSVPLPMTPELENDARAALTNNDLVIVSADTLTTRALPAILHAVGESGTVIVYGTGVPCTASFFAFDMPIRMIGGFYPRFPETLEAAALRDISDPTPGLFPFRVTPQTISRLHERKAPNRYFASPYAAQGFNQRFNPWEGKDYDRTQWSPLYKG